MEIYKPNVYFQWDSNKTDKSLSVTDSNTKIKCLTSIGPHKNAIGDLTLNPGNVSYWEVKILKGNCFKVGVTKSKALKTNGSFSDDEDGWSYYSVGQIRHNSKTEGSTYGEPYGIDDVVGVLFDQFEGVLSFYLNGKFLGEAFQSEDFTNFSFYPVVSCLNQDEQLLLVVPDRED